MTAIPTDPAKNAGRLLSLPLAPQSLSSLAPPSHSATLSAGSEEASEEWNIVNYTDHKGFQGWNTNFKPTKDRTSYSTSDCLRASHSYKSMVSWILQ